MFVGWNFLGTFKLASAGPLVAISLPRVGFRLDLRSVFVVSDDYYAMYVCIYVFMYVFSYSYICTMYNV